MNRARRLPGSLALASLLALGGCTESGSAGTDELADASESKGATGSMDSSEGLESSEASSASDSSESSNSTNSTSATSESTDSSESGGMTCSYPMGAVEPMALGEVLTPYSWTTAIHGDGTTTSLDLFYAPCDTDEVIDWSIHEILVFISLPAW